MYPPSRRGRAFGAPWRGFIGPLPMDNATSDTWAEFYIKRRVLPYLAQARDLGVIDQQGAASIEGALDHLAELPGADERPARIHGDLWSGNVIWGAQGASLIDPAAHGGHRETDLAMLALFGLPFLDHVTAAYHEVFPLEPRWQQRMGIHQLHPLLVHAVLFGSSYGAQAVNVARRYA